jgi:hypothetical protein
MDRHDRVGGVVLAGEHLARLRAFDFLLQLLQRAGEVRVDVLTGAGPFDEHADVIAAAFERLEEGSVFFEPSAALHHLLRLRLIAPEVGRGNPRLYFSELFIETSAFKDASAARARACSGLRSAW